MGGAASQAGDADSSRAPGLTSGSQGSVNVHRGALLLVPQWQCISSFVFYIGIHPPIMMSFQMTLTLTMTLILKIALSDFVGIWNIVKNILLANYMRETQLIL